MSACVYQKFRRATGTARKENKKCSNSNKKATGNRSIVQGINQIRGGDIERSIRNISTAFPFNGCYALNYTKMEAIFTHILSAINCYCGYRQNYPFDPQCDSNYLPAFKCLAKHINNFDLNNYECFKIAVKSCSFIKCNRGQIIIFQFVMENCAHCKVWILSLQNIMNDWIWKLSKRFFMTLYRRLTDIISDDEYDFNSYFDLIKPDIMNHQIKDLLLYDMMKVLLSYNYNSLDVIFLSYEEFMDIQLELIGYPFRTLRINNKRIIYNKNCDILPIEQVLNQYKYHQCISLLGGSYIIDGIEYSKINNDEYHKHLNRLFLCGERGPFGKYRKMRIGDRINQYTNSNELNWIWNQIDRYYQIDCSGQLRKGWKSFQSFKWFYAIQGDEYKNVQRYYLLDLNNTIYDHLFHICNLARMLKNYQDRTSANTQNITSLDGVKYQYERFVDICINARIKYLASDAGLEILYNYIDCIDLNSEWMNWDLSIVIATFCLGDFRRFKL